MQRLDARDVHRLVDAVAEIGSLSHDLPFPPETLSALAALIPAESVSYCELDRVARHTLTVVDRDGDPTEGTDEATFWRFEPHHPLCAYQRSGGFDASRISDHLTRREFHRLEIYAEFFRPWSVEHQLEVGLPAQPTHTKTFVFDRQAHDFSERDRLLHGRKYSV